MLRSVCKCKHTPHLPTSSSSAGFPGARTWLEGGAARTELGGRSHPGPAVQRLPGASMCTAHRPGWWVRARTMGPF